MIECGVLYIVAYIHKQFLPNLYMCNYPSLGSRPSLFNNHCTVNCAGVGMLKSRGYSYTIIDQWALLNYGEPQLR